MGLEGQNQLRRVSTWVSRLQNEQKRVCLENVNEIRENWIAINNSGIKNFHLTQIHGNIQM